VGADVGERAVVVVVVVVVAGLSCDFPSVFLPSASSFLPLARRPDCSSPACLLSTVGDVFGGAASVMAAVLSKAPSSSGTCEDGLYTYLLLLLRQCREQATVLWEQGLALVVLAESGVQFVAQDVESRG
jgi:hypothetical protein